MSASPGHYIDAGSATQDLAHIQRDAASIEIGIGLGHKAPVTLTPEVEGPLDRFDYAWNIVAAACLKQKYADVEVLGQPAGYHRTGRARSADDEIVMRLELSCELLLTSTNLLDEIFGLSIYVTAGGNVCLAFHNSDLSILLVIADMSAAPLESLPMKSEVKVVAIAPAQRTRQRVFYPVWWAQNSELWQLPVVAQSVHGDTAVRPEIRTIEGRTSA